MADARGRHGALNAQSDALRMIQCPTPRFAPWAIAVAIG